MESDHGARMMGDDGREWRLVSGTHAAVLENAHGVTVQLEGARLGRTLWVNHWTITDGGDGSSPYVGTLRRLGQQWMLDDLNSGSTIIFVDQSLGALTDYEGHIVMVSGFVTGAHRINAVRWTVLE